MITNSLFRQCLSEVDNRTRTQFELSFAISERLNSILKKKGITQHDLAQRLGKRDSEISKWLTGRHNFTTGTIANIENAIGEKIIQVTQN